MVVALLAIGWSTIAFAQPGGGIGGLPPGNPSRKPGNGENGGTLRPLDPDLTSPPSNPPGQGNNP